MSENVDHGAALTWVDSGCLPPEVEETLRSASARIQAPIGERDAAVARAEAAEAERENIRREAARVRDRNRDLEVAVEKAASERDQLTNELLALRVAKEQAEAALAQAEEQRARAGALLLRHNHRYGVTQGIRDEIDAALANEPPKGGER